MSLHHLVTIHCDICGEWIHGDDQPTRLRRKAGWIIWKDENSGRLQHTCPSCAAKQVSS